MPIDRPIAAARSGLEEDLTLGQSAGHMFNWSGLSGRALLTTSLGSSGWRKRNRETATSLWSAWEPNLNHGGQATKMKILSRFESAIVVLQCTAFPAGNSGAVKIHWPMLCSPHAPRRHTYHTKNYARPVGYWDGYNSFLSIILPVELFCWADLCSLERHTPYS